MLEEEPGTNPDAFGREMTRQTFEKVKVIAEVQQSHSRRLASIESKVDRIETRFDGLETRFDGLETRFDGVESKLDDIYGRVRDQSGDNLEHSAAFNVVMRELREIRDRLPAK